MTRGCYAAHMSLFPFDTDDVVEWFCGVWLRGTVTDVSVIVRDGRPIRPAYDVSLDSLNGTIVRVTDHRTLRRCGTTLEVARG